jgi:hypothetical protein
MSVLAATLNGAAVISASTAPTIGSINTYNASAGNLTPSLPALSGLTDGVSMVIQKDPLDVTTNTVTFTRSGSDTFQDGTTNYVLGRTGSWAVLQVVTVSSTKYWKVTMCGTPEGATFLSGTGLVRVAGGVYSALAAPAAASAPELAGGLTANTAQVNLNTSTTETSVITFTLPTGSLVAGSTFRLKVRGTVQVQATSGTLTFRPYLGANVSTETFQMASQGTAAGPVAFNLEVDITVRTVGASGTYVANGFGRIEFATAVILTTTIATTAVVDTTAATPVVKLTAQWATSSATNILKVETATVERII